MGSTVPALRLIIQQSNCFVIVDRGRGLAARNREADLIRGEEGRAGSNYGKGQIAAADYTMIPEVILSIVAERGPGGLGGCSAVQSWRRRGRRGSMSTNEAGAILTSHNRLVQLAAAEGYSKNIDFAGLGGFFGGGAAGGAGLHQHAREAVFAAFTDSYNKMVRAAQLQGADCKRGL
jgi:hypothetical protein